MTDTILSVQELSVSFATDEGEVSVLDNISFDLQRGQTLALVGESGCGKSVTSLAIMRLLPQPAGIINNGKIIFDNKDLLSQPLESMYTYRGKRIAMIFQEPMTALNPVHTIGKQLAEIYTLHFPSMDDVEITKASVELLEKVGIPAAKKRLQEYPHQLSGGMRQRVMIAMALACKPDILIADEPTTALDVTIQAQILLLMQELQKEMQMSIIFITHDMGVVAQLCDEVIVMYAGRIVEQSSVQSLFANPMHPYTRGLLTSIPTLEIPRKQVLNVIPGTVPSIKNMPSGCRFRNRCIHAQELCSNQVPKVENINNNHSIACLRWRENLYDG